MNLLERREEVERAIREADCRLGMLVALQDRLGVPDEALERAIRKVSLERRGLMCLYQSLDEDMAPMC